MKLPRFKSEIRFGLPLLPIYIDAVLIAYIQRLAQISGRVFYSQSTVWITESGSKGEVVLSREEYENLWKWIITNRNLVYNQYDPWVKKKNRFIQKLNSVIKNKRNSLTLFNSLFEEYVSIYAVAGITSAGLVGSELIVKQLSDLKISKDDAAFFVSPRKLSFLGLNRLNLLKLASIFPSEVVLFNDLEKKYHSYLTKIKQHSQKYHWVLNNNKDVQILSSEFFFNQIKEIYAQNNQTKIYEEIKQLEKQEKENTDKLNKLKKRYKLSSELEESVETSVFLAEWGDERKQLLSLGNTLLFCFVSYAEKELGVSLHDLEYFTVEEINAILTRKKKFEYPELNRRKDAILMIYTTNKVEIYSGAEVHKILAKVSPKITEVDVIEGITASQGKVSGKVRIILDPFKEKLQPGEILVTSMTRPDFVVLMEKAAAFVTDDGGITSHAGILAREMGKPCIVGTNIATKVLKNGDFIEVDADHGRIIKLKNK